MSGASVGSLLVNGYCLINESIKGRKEGQVLGRQPVGASSASGAEGTGKRKGRLMVAKWSGSAVGMYSTNLDNEGSDPQTW